MLCLWLDLGACWGLRSGKKKEPKPKLFGPDILGWGGVFHVKGRGPKSSVCPLKPGKPNFFGGISRDFAGISRGCPKSLGKNKFVFNFCSVFESRTKQTLQKVARITFSAQAAPCTPAKQSLRMLVPSVLLEPKRLVIPNREVRGDVFRARRFRLQVHTALFQRSKRNPNTNFLVPWISSGGLRVFHVKGWRPKSSVCPSNQGNQTFWRDIPGFWPGYPG